LLFQLTTRLVEDWQSRHPATGEELRPEFTAFAAATLFAVHPLMSSAVGYIAARAEILCGTFFLAAMLAARQWFLRGGVGRWLLTAVLWLGALGSKEPGAVFPFVLLCYGRLVLGGTAAEKRRRLFGMHVPFLAFAIVAGLLRVGTLSAIEHPGDTSIYW